MVESEINEAVMNGNAETGFDSLQIVNGVDRLL